MEVFIITESIISIMINKKINYASIFQIFVLYKISLCSDVFHAAVLCKIKLIITSN